MPYGTPDPYTSTEFEIPETQATDTEVAALLQSYPTTTEMNAAIDAIPDPVIIPAIGDRFVTGRYYTTPFCNVTGASSSAQQDAFRCVPFPVGRAQSFDRIGVGLTSNAAAGALLRFGIYEDDGNGKPGVLVLDAGTIAADSGATVFKEKTIDVDLDVGLYWIGVVQQIAGAGGVIMLSTATTGWGFNGYNGLSAGATVAATSLIQAAYQITATGALPNPAGSVTSLGPVASATPCTMLRAAA